MALIAAGVAPALRNSPPIVNSTELRVEVISDYRSFLSLEPDWSRLAGEARLDHPFVEHLWVRTWWECFGEGSRMHILLVKDGERAVAIAPLMLTPVKMFGVTLRRLGFFYNAHVPRAEFLVANGSEDAYAAMWHHLLRNPCWDLLQLCQLAEGSQTLDSITRLAAGHGSVGTRADLCIENHAGSRVESRAETRVERWTSGECPYVPVRTSTPCQSWDEYFSGLPAKHRANLRNRTKRLEARGFAGMETIDSAHGLADALNDGLRLEAAAWKGEAGTAISCEPALARFYSLLAQRASERGWLQLNFLKSGVERIAFDYSLCYKGRVFLLKHGYDPAHSQFSPSNLLLQCAIQSAFEHGLDEYEILGDSTDWKRSWTKHAKKHYWLYVFAGNLKARFAHTVKFRVAPVLKRRFETAPWAAKLLRRGA